MTSRMRIDGVWSDKPFIPTSNREASQLSYEGVGSCEQHPQAVPPHQCPAGTRIVLILRGHTVFALVVGDERLRNFPDGMFLDDPQEEIEVFELTKCFVEGGKLRQHLPP